MRTGYCVLGKYVLGNTCEEVDTVLGNLLLYRVMRLGNMGICVCACFGLFIRHDVYRFLALDTRTEDPSLRRGMKIAIQ